ncbi:MAG: cation:proton antiporter [Candidatus Aenigmatarchaeota archaeon]
MSEAQLFLAIALLLISAKMLGELVERIKINSLAGEILAGIIVGPVLGWVTPSAILGQIAGLGIIFLMFFIGLSTRFDDIKQHTYMGTAIASMGAFLTLIGGIAAGILIFHDFNIGLFLGIAMISTSTAIPIKTLIDYGEFNTHVGKSIVIIAMADDIIAILGLSFLVSYFSLGTIKVWEIMSLFLAVLGFIVLVLTAGSRVAGKLLSWVQYMKDEQILISVPLFIVFVFAFVGEHVGIAAVTGAFLAGMTISKSPFTPVIIPKLKTFGYGLFIPLFFAYSAVFIDLHAIYTHIWLIITLVVIGSLAKAIGSGAFSRYFGFRGRDQAIIAVSMVPRGEYGIVISQIALAAGIITGELYTVMISFVVLTIFITPLLFRFVMRK